jgi:hypothetical protein
MRSRRACCAAAQAADEVKESVDNVSHIDDVAAVRPFNRFYTSRLGMVRNGRHGTGHPPAEARVLYELGQADALDVIGAQDPAPHRRRPAEPA